MFDKIQTLNLLSDIEAIYGKMDEIYGRQEHISSHIIKNIGELFPGLCLYVKSTGDHILYIPFNKTGYERMLSDELSEADIQMSDIYNPSIDKNVYKTCR